MSEHICKQNKSKIIRFITIFMVATFVVISTLGLVDNTVVYASTLQELEAQIKKLEEDNKKLNSNLNNISGKIQDEHEKQADLAGKIKNTEQQIALYKQKIELMEKEIAGKKEEITGKEGEIFDNEELFAQRVRAMYISGSSSVLTTILSADSFSEFLSRAEILKRISKSDQDLINSLTTEKEELIAIKTSLEEQNKKLNETKQQFSSASANLASMKKQSEKNEAELKRIWNKYYADKKANEKQIQKQEAEVARIIAMNSGSGTAPEGPYKWPVPASSRITSPFGWRTMFGNREYHRGIDIGAPAGTSIVAAHAGRVISVSKQSYGYGWHVIVDHGGGYVTLYAHCSRIDVSVGDVVARGQTIAGVGTTGNSTGNHLHFEVRVNGERVNPMGYVTRP